MEQTKSSMSKFIHIARINVGIVSSTVSTVRATTKIASFGRFFSCLKTIVISPFYNYCAIIYCLTNIIGKPFVVDDILIDGRKNLARFLEAFLFVPMRIQQRQLIGNVIVKTDKDRVP